jgi:hypothetical protein
LLLLCCVCQSHPWLSSYDAVYHLLQWRQQAHHQPRTCGCCAVALACPLAHLRCLNHCRLRRCHSRCHCR